MIKIKSEINKTKTFKELEEYAFAIYRNSYEPDERMKDFMEGAEKLLNMIRETKNK